MSLGTTTIKDPLYGQVEISERVLIDLIKTPAFLRLKNITQAGVPQQYNSLKVYSRYEHSIGVMLLLRKLGADLEEQVAGLLHDISHLAFSHVAEWVFEENGSTSEGLNETLTEKFLEQTEINEVLNSNGFTSKKIAQLYSYKFLKKPMPLLCADSLDYSLREIFKWRDKATAKKILSHLKTKGNMIYFDDFNSALAYGREFVALQTGYWGSFDAVFRYHAFSKVLKRLVDLKALKFEDFLKDETSVIKVVGSSRDPEVKKSLTVLRHKSVLKYRGLFGARIKKKFRYADPHVLSGGKLVVLTRLSRPYDKLLKAKMAEAEEGVTI